MQGVLAYPDAELAAVCDIDEAKIEETLTKLNEDREIPANPTRYTDYKELLKHPGLNTVIIVTPDQLHREMAEAALAAGMHVLCEKPLALTIPRFHVGGRWFDDVVANNARREAEKNGTED